MGILEEAHRYANAGLYVIPIRERDKRPAIRTGPEHMKMATVSHGVIWSWFTKHPEWNVAIACSSSRIVVIDVDGPEGETVLAHFVRVHGELPATWEAKTSRGRHLLYRWPEGHRIATSSAGPKLDIRGAGSYIVAPPSIHPSGSIYEWTVTDVPIPEAPKWLVDWTPTPATVTQKRSAGVAGVDRDFAIDITDAMWDAVIEQLLFRGNTAGADFAREMKREPCWNV